MSNTKKYLLVFSLGPFADLAIAISPSMHGIVCNGGESVVAMLTETGRGWGRGNLGTLYFEASKPKPTSSVEAHFDAIQTVNIE